MLLCVDTAVMQAVMTENIVSQFKGREKSIQMRFYHKNVSEEVGSFFAVVSFYPFKHHTACGKSPYLINMHIFYILQVS